MVCEIYKPQILESMTGKNGDSNWIGQYNPAVRDFIDSMSEEQREEVQAKVEEWNSHGPEDKVKQR